MWSCSSNYFQLCKVSSDLPTSSSGAYQYTNQDVEIQYNFWSYGGKIYFSIKNNTDNALYIDLSKSFLIKNGNAYDYFLNRTITSSSALTTSKGTESSVNTLGYFNSSNHLYKTPGSLTSFDISSLSSQHTISISSEEQKIVIIPPHAAKDFGEYYIMTNRYQDCDLYEAPSKKNSVSMDFNLLTSPVAFTNLICYRVCEEGTDQIIENNFFIKEVTNQHYKSTIHKIKSGCSSDQYQPKIEVFISTSPKSFYIEYDPRSQKNTNKSSTKRKNLDDIYGE